MASHKRCIAFDADYTLISYNFEPFMSMQYRSLCSCMITLGVPSSILSEEYTRSIATHVSNGLIADFRTGYLLKLDENERILSAYHGYQKVDKSVLGLVYEDLAYPLENLSTYYIKDDRYLFISQFASGGAHAFRVCNELVRRGEMSMTPSEIGQKIYEAAFLNYAQPQSPSELSPFYQEIYSDPGSFFLKASDQLKSELLRLRDDNTKVLLITNSIPDYVKFAFKYCFGDDYFKYFDYLIYAARKPLFFTEENEFVQLSEKEFKYGNQAELKRMVPADEYFYVGDNFIADILGSHSANWVSCLLHIELVFEKEYSGVLNSPEEVENWTSSHPPHFEIWGSDFKQQEKKTFWWDFSLKHSRIIGGSIEGILSTF